MSVCTFKRLPFICFRFGVSAFIVFFSIYILIQKMVSTPPIHNDSHTSFYHLIYREYREVVTTRLLQASQLKKEKLVVGMHASKIKSSISLKGGFLYI